MASTAKASDPLDLLLSSPLGSDVSFLLARANALSLGAGNEALAPLGLKVRSYSVLALADAGAGPTQRELSEFLRLDPSQIVALVDDLQERGLVHRRPDPSDRRRNAVEATAAGRDLLGQAQRAAAAAERALHSGLTADERAALAALLRRIAFA